MKTTRWAIGALVLIALALPPLAIADDLLDTIDSLMQAGAEDRALEKVRQALVSPDWRTTADSQSLAIAFNLLARIHYSKRAYDSSALFADSALAYHNQRPDRKAAFEAELLESRGKALRRLRQPEQAAAALAEAVRVLRQAPENYRTALARALNLEALARREAGELAAATASAKEAVAISDSLGSDQDPQTAQYCNTLARCLQMQGRSSEAALLFQKAITLSISEPGPDHTQLAGFYNNLGNAYSDMGRFEEALASYQQSLAIREKEYGPDHRRVAQALNNVALVYYNAGQYAEAEARYRRALAIFKHTLGPRHEYVALMGMNLGALYLAQRRFGDAETILLEGRSILEEVAPDGHPRIAGILTNLAIVARHTDRPDDAARYLHEALALKQARYGADSPELASTLNSLGVLAFSRNQFDTARGYLERALAIERAAFGNRHPEVGARLLNLGELHSRLGNYVLSDSLYAEAIDIWQAAYGSHNRWLAEAWERRAVSLRRRGELETAWTLLQKAFDIRLALFTENARVLSEPDALAYSTFLQHTTELLLSTWHDLPRTPERDTVAARVVFSSKGKVWDELVSRVGLWQESADSTSTVLADKIRNTRWQLARAYVAGPDASQETYRQTLDSLDRMIEDLESRLAERNADYRSLLATAQLSMEDVVNRIPEQTLLLDYLRYNYWPPEAVDPIPRYLCVAASNRAVRTLGLGPAKQIDAVVGQYRDHFATVAALGTPVAGDLEAYRAIAVHLFKLVLAPVLTDADAIPDLWLAPDGPLCLVAWAGLVTSERDSTFLLETRNVTYLGSGRDLLRPASTVTEKSGLLAVGDVDYDAGATEATSLANLRAATNVPGPVSALPGTRAELDAIAATWAQSHQEPIELLSGAEATESRVKREAPKFGALHLATHGFYAGSATKIESYALIDFSFQRPAIANPLLRTGLYFAGVNRIGDDSTADDDGVLTALEASAMPLAGTESVVLSACETGLGAVVESEGVSGLRRAFHLAGVETVVSALWPVSDARTSQLMQRLYEDTELTMAHRLIKYQREMIASLRASGESDHPFLWAPFIAVTRH